MMLPRFIIPLVIFLPLICSAQSRQDSLQIVALVDSILQQKVSDGPGAKVRTRKLIARCIHYKDLRYLGRAYMLLSTIYDDAGDYQASGKCCDSAYLLYTKAGFALGQGQYFNNTGLSLKKQNRFTEAVEAFTKGLRLADSLKNERLLSQLSNNLGILFNDMEQPARALPYLEQAAVIHQKSGNRARLGKVYQNMAVSYELMGKLKKAATLYTDAIGILEAEADSSVLAYSYDNLSGLYVKLKDLPQAYRYCHKALAVALRVEDRTELGLVYNNLASICHKLGKREEELDCAKKALSIAQEVNNKREQSRACAHLADYYEVAGDLSKAIEWRKQEVAITVALFTENAANATSEAMVKYETEKKEKEKELLAQQKKIVELELNSKARENESQMKTIIILIILFVLTVLSVVFIVLYNRMKTQRQALEAAARLRDEKERISRDLHDNIGSQISFILRNLEWIQQEHPALQEQEQRLISSVNTAGRDLMQSIRETIWALKNDRITLESFGDRVYSSLKKYNEGGLVKVRVKQQIEQNTFISALESLNLLRIIQEAVNNAFKYSGASEILIQVGANAQYKYHVQVSDQGLGMNLQALQKKEHYGIENMKHRAAEIGAVLQLQSEPGMGTRISIYEGRS